MRKECKNTSQIAPNDLTSRQKDVQSRHVRRMRWYRAKARARCAISGGGEGAKRTQNSLGAPMLDDTSLGGRDVMVQTAVEDSLEFQLSHCLSSEYKASGSFEWSPLARRTFCSERLRACNRPTGHGDSKRRLMLDHFCPRTSTLDSATPFSTHSARAGLCAHPCASKCAAADRLIHNSSSFSSIHSSLPLTTLTNLPTSARVTPVPTPLARTSASSPPPTCPSSASRHPLPLTMSDNQSEQTRETIETFEMAEAKKKTDEKRDLKYDSHRSEPGAASYDRKKHMDTPAEDHVWGFTPSKHGAAAEEKKKERQADHRARSHHSNTNMVEIPGFTAPPRK